MLMEALKRMAVPMAIGALFGWVVTGLPGPFGPVVVFTALAAAAVYLFWAWRDLQSAQRELQALLDLPLPGDEP